MKLVLDASVAVAAVRTGEPDHPTAWKLRGADAVYVSLARRLDLPLCTLDRDVVRRASRACRVLIP